MPFFARFKSPLHRSMGDVADGGDTTPKQEPYKHIPMHAARDARSQVPPGTRKRDRQAIAEHHKRRSQMPDINTPVVRLNMGLVVDEWSVGQRDVPYVSKQPPISKRPTANLKELKCINTQQKKRAARRAAYVEPTADVTYHLGLLPSPLTQNMPTTTGSLDPPTIPLPTRRHPPLSELCNTIRSRHREQSFVKQGSTTEVSDVASRSSSSCGSNLSIHPKSTASSRSSEEPLYPAPTRNRARDSLSFTIAQDSQFHKPTNDPIRRLRAAAHDSTGIEQAMASPESFQPQRAPPVIVRNDSAYPVLPIASFDFGTERPYTPERLRPWLSKDRNNVSQCTSMVSAI
jgi:hypothetical protein